MPRIPFARLMPFVCLLALGCLDTVQAQNLTLNGGTAPVTLTFSTAPGVNPPTQTVSTGSTGGSFSYSVSYTASWISAATSAFNPSSGTTGQTLTVQVTVGAMPSSLNPYTATIKLIPTNGSPEVDITVSLTITGAGTTAYTLLPSLKELDFNLQLGKGSPPAQTVQITSSGIALPISSITPVESSCSQQPWLQVSASAPATTTPLTLTVTIAPGTLAGGVCGGDIVVTSTTPSNGTTTASIHVQADFSATPVMYITIPAGSTSVTAVQNQGPNPNFNIELTSSDPTVPLSFTATTSPNTPWLAAPAPASGATGPNGQSLYVQITPGSTTPGTYTGSITITSSALFGGVLTIPITFTLLSQNAVTVSRRPRRTAIYQSLQCHVQFHAGAGRRSAGARDVNAHRLRQLNFYGHGALHRLSAGSK